MEAGQQLVALLAQRAAQAATDRVTNLSDRLTSVTENGGAGVISTLRGERADNGDRAADDDDSDDSDDEERQGIGSRIGGALGGLKDKVAGLFGGGGGGGGKGKKLKVTVISESLDIGLPLRATYNLWTQYEDFPGFMKKVENVDQDAEKSTWKAQVFWSHREWQATTVEQVPDSHIVWKSTGAKGHVDGAVTFTELGPNLTRVMLVMEYYPQGLFERTGNIWRAQGRRARLEFQHFRRHAMTDALLHPDDIEGWRGEIRDSEVVMTHEEALEEEGQQTGEDQDEEARAEGVQDGDAEAEGDEGLDEDAGTEDEAAEYDEAEEDADEPADEYEEGGEQVDDSDEPVEEADEYDDTDEPVDEGDEYDEADEPVDEGDEDDAGYQDEVDDDSDDSDAGEPRRNGRRRREPGGARSSRGR
jgi:hypothetical protein